MKRLLTLAVVLLLLPFCALAQEEAIEFKTMSYTELFNLIEAETDSVFRLSNIIVEYEDTTDSLFSSLVDRNDNILKPVRKETLVIDKAIELVNVQFAQDFDNTAPEGVILKGRLNNIRFNKKVSITGLFNVYILQCEFMGDLELRGRYSIWATYIKDLKAKKINSQGYIELYESKIHSNVDISYSAFGKEEELDFTNLDLWENEFLLEPNKDGSTPNILIRSTGNNNFDFSGNVLLNKGQFRIYDDGTKHSIISENDFNDTNVEFQFFNEQDRDQLDFYGNTFNGIISLGIDQVKPIDRLDFQQFNGRLISRRGLYSYGAANYPEVSNQEWDDLKYSLSVSYFEQGRASLEASFEEEIVLRGMFFNYFKAKFLTKKANGVYVDMKNLETARLKYEYNTDATFKTFFSWKINQFLKIFSAYGTEPARAIVFSVWVILAFAFIYLLFPNSWDSHGKNRIMDRYRFFLKYLNKEEGMHEVYLEDQQEELLTSEDFKTYLLDQGKTAPKFFLATAMPLYRWSVASTKTFSWFLEKIDFLKGKWSDTESSKQGGKTFLLITAFLIALLYDIFIKMLNALMLSINTFTTLGFGEIPIKGLPRYLAIIQGFIGWFMLTIFSVSLISQLLN